MIIVYIFVCLVFVAACDWQKSFNDQIFSCAHHLFTCTTYFSLPSSFLLPPPSLPLSIPPFSPPSTPSLSLFLSREVSTRTSQDAGGQVTSYCAKDHWYSRKEQGSERKWKVCVYVQHTEPIHVQCHCAHTHKDTVYYKIKSDSKTISQTDIISTEIKL